MFTSNVSRKCELISNTTLLTGSCLLYYIYSPVMYASILAANPTKHNQFALGLSDGGVLVKELRRILEMAM